MNGTPDFVYEESDEEDREAFLEAEPPINPAKRSEPLAQAVINPAKHSEPLAQPVIKPTQPTQPLGNPFEAFESRRSEEPEESDTLETPQELNAPNAPNAFEKPMNAKGSVLTTSSALAETIELPHAAFRALLPHIEPHPHPSKFHHFRFRHARDRSRIEAALKSVDPAMTVAWNDGQGNVDVTLSSHQAPVGKIQFLHFDRRDRGDRSKYYAKLYFYQFQSTDLFHRVMEAVKGVLMNMQHASRSTPMRHTRKPMRKPTRKSTLRNRRTHRSRRARPARRTRKI